MRVCFCRLVCVFVFVCRLGGHGCRTRPVQGLPMVYPLTLTEPPNPPPLFLCLFPTPARGHERSPQPPAKKNAKKTKARSFRLKLRGITPDGALLPNVRVLVGEVIDCMASNGRWFQTEISEIETVRPPGGSGGGSKSKVGCAVICPIPVFTTMDRN